MHDGNDRTFMCANNATNSSNINISQLMIVNTSNVHGTVGFEDNSNIITSKSTICSAINKG